MTQAAPYLFDRAFEVSKSGSDSSEATARAKLKEEWERKMADACIRSFEEGQEAGKAEALQRLEAETLEQVRKLVDTAQSITRAIDSECNAIRRNATKIAIATANLLAGELVSRNPTLNLEVLFGDALEHAGDAPHIALTVNDACAEAIQAKVGKIAAERGYTGKIVVLGDPETKTGDCSLQWADGGIVVDRKKVEQQISNIVRAHLERIAGPGQAQTSPAAAAPSPQSHETAADTGNAPGDTP